MVMTKETQLMGKKVSNAEAWKKKEWTYNPINGPAGNSRVQVSTKEAPKRIRRRQSLYKQNDDIQNQFSL